MSKRSHQAMNPKVPVPDQAARPAHAGKPQVVSGPDHPDGDAAHAGDRSQGRVAPRAEPSTEGAKQHGGGRHKR